jgi:plasmid stabilization system protein ParE
MRKITLSIDASNDLDRVIDFLATKSPEAAARAQNVIADQLEKILLHPLIYRPVPDRPDQRETVIAFGSYGYVLRYFFDQEADAVSVLRLWHQREQQ